MKRTLWTTPEIRSRPTTSRCSLSRRSHRHLTSLTSLTRRQALPLISPTPILTRITTSCCSFTKVTQRPCLLITNPFINSSITCNSIRRRPQVRANLQVCCRVTKATTRALTTTFPR